MKVFASVQRALRFVAEHYLVFLIVLSVLLAPLNYHGKAMTGMLPYYLDQKRVVLGGFEPAVSQLHVPTFPMWGYGWMFMITQSKPVLIVIQEALAISAYWYFFRTAQKHELFPAPVLDTSKVLLVFALPLYAFHAILWPYSVGFSLLLFSFTLLLIGLADYGRPVLKTIVVSGVIFGVMLNFRSDYCMLPIALAGAILVLHRTRAHVLRAVLVWAVSTYALLVPWILFTKHVSGRALLTSSNGGMAIYLGLGDLPGNVWGITPFDDDPQAHRVVAEALGPGTNPLSAQSDVVLKREALNNVRRYPREYVRRLVYLVPHVVAGGIYKAEFFADANCSAHCGQEFMSDLTMGTAPDAGKLSRIGGGVWNSLSGHSHVSRARLFGAALSGAGYVYGVVMLLMSYLLAPITLLLAYRRRHLGLLLATLIVLFQACINIFIVHEPALSTNAFFMDILNLAFWVMVARAWKRGERVVLDAAVVPS